MKRDEILRILGITVMVLLMLVNTTSAAGTLFGKITPLITWSNPADITYGTALSSAQFNAVAIDPVTNAQVNGYFGITPGTGTILSVGTHTLHVDFTPTDTATYATASKDVTINVVASTPPQKKTPTIMWFNPRDITYGTALSSSYQVNYDPSAIETQLDAWAADPTTYIPVPGTLTYTPPAGTVLNAGTWTLHVDFTPSDTTNYNTASADVTINVLKATPSFSIYTQHIPYGTALSSNNVQVSNSVPGTYTYTPPFGTVLNAGTQTINIDFTPSDSANFNSVSETATINVQKATPTVTWSNPADIRDKTALSDTQLNAVASILGVFVYTPASGTILNAGTQTLKVDFTPTDTANYNSVSQTITINVLSNNGNGNTDNGNHGNENNGNHGNGNNGNGNGNNPNK